MFKKISTPPSFSLLKKGNVYLLLHKDYKGTLLQQGVGDLKNLLHQHDSNTHYFSGRTPHPSILLQNGNRMVIRQYSHGGWLRAITGSLFFFGTRSFRELSLTEEIRSCGIPTIEPIAAIHRTLLSPFYQPFLLTLEVPGALNPIQYLQRMGPRPSREHLLHKREIIRSAGLLLRKFHQAGFYHADLQLKNLLVVGDQVLIIDFDRSYRKKTLSEREKMKNLLRLNRSVEKWKRSGLLITRTDRWRFLLAYAGGNQEILKVMQRVPRTYFIGLFFHRIGWAIEDRVRG